MQVKYLLTLGFVPGMLAAVPSPSPVAQKNAVTTPQPTQPGMVGNCNAFYKVVSGDTCESIINKFGTFSYANFYQWNPSINTGCTNLQINNYYCVGVGSSSNLGFQLKTRYSTDCTGNVYNDVSVDINGGVCVNTDCNVGSLEIAAAGACPNGQVQVSYWEGQNCQGKWFGYGYASRNQCRGLWSDGWKFRSLHFRCANPADDCVTKRTCQYDAEPAQGTCRA